MSSDELWFISRFVIVVLNVFVMLLYLARRYFYGSDN